MTDSITFNVPDEKRKAFLYALTRDYLEAIFQKAQTRKEAFIAMSPDERSALADSLMTWFKDVIIQPFGQRLLAKVEMETFQMTIRNAVASLVRKIQSESLEETSPALIEGIEGRLKKNRSPERYLTPEQQEEARERQNLRQPIKATGESSVSPSDAMKYWKNKEKESQKPPK